MIAWLTRTWRHLFGPYSLLAPWGEIARLPEPKNHKAHLQQGERRR